MLYKRSERGLCGESGLPDSNPNFWLAATRRTRRRRPGSRPPTAQNRFKVAFHRLGCDPQNNANFLVGLTLGHPIQNLGGTSPESEYAKFSNVTGRTLYPQCHDVRRCVMIASQPPVKAASPRRGPRLPRTHGHNVRGKSRKLSLNPLPHSRRPAAMERSFLRNERFEVLLGKLGGKLNCTQKIQRDQTSAD